MNFKRYLLIASFVLPVAGCATRQYQGGTADDSQYQTGIEKSYSGPDVSPSFRPGMNREDPRDAHFTTRPQAVNPPITSP